MIKDDIQLPGLIFYKMGTKDDDFANRFLKAKGKRFKVCIKKSFKVTDLIQFISDNTKIPAVYYNRSTNLLGRDCHLENRNQQRANNSSHKEDLYFRNRNHYTAPC